MFPRFVMCDGLRSRVFSCIVEPAHPNT